MLRTAFVLLATVGGLLVSGAPAGAEALPRPEGLEPNVRFWTRIYAEIDSGGGLIHDSRNLDVVYESLRFAPGSSRRQRERQVERAKRKYVTILKRLAGGKRTGLSAEESHVLGRWPGGVTNGTLRTAARNVRFQLGQADRFRAGVARSGAYRDEVVQVLASYDVPVELVALPHVESSFNPAAYSRIGAAGMWQFTRGTGRLYMRVDHVVDERLDARKATVAAARLLRNNFERLGTWPLAITAYNHGVGGMARAVRKVGTTDIATISKHYNGRTFGFASRNFYAEFLAAHDVDSDAERYFGPVQLHRPRPHHRVELDAFYAAKTLERAFGVDRDTLRSYNPALRPAVWNGTKYVPKGYVLELPPTPRSEPLEEVIASIPPGERMAEQHRDKFYKVRRGDSLSRIARRFRVRERDLVIANNLRSRHQIRAGQVLVLPDDAVGGGVQVARSEPPADGIYRVRRGDNVTVIARRFGVSEAALVAENRLRDKHHIAVGQRLRIPGAGPAPATAAAPTPAAAKPVAAEPAVATAAPGAVPALAVEPASPTAVAASEPPPVAAAEPPAPVAAAEPTATAAVVEPTATLAAVEPTEPVALPDPTAALAVVQTPAPVAAAESTAPPVAPVAVVNGRPATDPSDYAVDGDGRITVQAAETLGHYAEWLEVKTSRLRRLNGLKFDAPVVIGRRAKLDFSRVTPETFESRRLAYHHTLQEEYFAVFEVTGTRSHRLKPGDSLWYLAERKYQVPIWLIRLYNPDVDLGDLKVGTVLVIPDVDDRTG